MTRYAALLRGINVGGHARVPMVDLRDACVGIGLRDVATYIQSGNMAFSSDQSERELVPLIEAAIVAKFGFHVPVILRSHAELQAIEDANPYPDLALAEPKFLSVQAFSEPLSPTLVAKLNPDLAPPEHFTIVGRDLYLHLPNGIGRSKLAEHLGAKLGKLGTVRNWNTVLKLLEMTAS
jgi:uncharacterized protein (DUF1697 family)